MRWEDLFSIYSKSSNEISDQTEQEAVEALFDELITKPKNEFIQFIKQSGFPENEVFVCVAEYFIGNNNEDCIGYNIFPDKPTLSDFNNILLNISGSSKTEHLLIRISGIEESGWPSSDMVYIAGDHTLQDVHELFAPLKPDQIFEGNMYDQKPSNLPDVSGTSKVFSVWWD